MLRERLSQPVTNLDLAISQFYNQEILCPTFLAKR